MRNNQLSEWIEDTSYFSSLAVLSQGPLHPGGLAPNQLLAARLDWKNVDVLDLGAGTGVSHRFFTALGSRVRSVEPNSWMRRAAVRAGVDPSEIHAASAEDIPDWWLSNNFSNARLLIQGVIGFLPAGLETLASILRHPSISEVVFVEWLQQPIGHGHAPVKHNYKAADYVGAVERGGFDKLWVETFRYCPTDNIISDNEAKSRVRWHFPEADEVDLTNALQLKLSTIRLPATNTKDFVVLVARRLHT